MVKGLSRVKELIVRDRALDALRLCLGRVPLGEISWEPAPPGVDCLVRAELARAPVRLILELKASGEPRQARDAANALLRARQTLPDAYPVFVAPYVSPRAAALCQEAGVGYLDMAGNCLLALDGIFVERAGHPNPFAAQRELRSLYYPKAERVLRVLLNHPKRTWTLQDLSTAASVSIGHVHKVKEKLLDLEWVAQDKVGLRMIDPMEALDRWADSYNFSRNEASLYYSLDIFETETTLPQVCDAFGTRCALTQFSGADRVAPYVRYQRTAAYVSDYHQKIAQSLGLRPVSSGANVLLLRPYDEGVYYGSRRVNTIPVVSDVQLYLDLRSSPARGEDAAAHLRRQEIEPAWET